MNEYETNDSAPTIDSKVINVADSYSLVKRTKEDEKRARYVTKIDTVLANSKEFADNAIAEYKPGKEAEFCEKYDLSLSGKILSDPDFKGRFDKEDIKNILYAELVDEEVSATGQYVKDNALEAVKKALPVADNYAVEAVLGAAHKLLPDEGESKDMTAKDLLDMEDEDNGEKDINTLHAIQKVGHEALDLVSNMRNMGVELDDSEKYTQINGENIFAFTDDKGKKITEFEKREVSRDYSNVVPELKALNDAIEQEIPEGSEGNYLVLAKNVVAKTGEALSTLPENLGTAAVAAYGTNNKVRENIKLAFAKALHKSQVEAKENAAPGEKTDAANATLDRLASKFAAYFHDTNAVAMARKKGVFARKKR